MITKWKGKELFTNMGAGAADELCLLFFQWHWTIWKLLFDLFNSYSREEYMLPFNWNTYNLSLVIRRYSMIYVSYFNMRMWVQIKGNLSVVKQFWYFIIIHLTSHRLECYTIQRAQMSNSVFSIYKEMWIMKQVCV